jgi:hypothetical protein
MALLSLGCQRGFRSRVSVWLSFLNLAPCSVLLFPAAGDKRKQEASKGGKGQPAKKGKLGGVGGGGKKK